MTQQLSPAAQAVRNAAGWQGTSLEREAQNIAAAVLRAAVNQTIPLTNWGHCYAYLAAAEIQDQLLAIADELEGSK
jgi:hypothetical protein